MKILNINSYYYSSSVHLELQKALKNLGINNSMTYVPLSRGYVARDECRYNDSTSDIYKSECFSYMDRYIFSIKHSKIFNDIKSKFDFKQLNISHAHSLFSNGFIAYKIKKNFGIPYVVAVRSTDINTFFKYMFHLRSLGTNILKEASHIVFLSASYRDMLLKKYVPDIYRKQIYEKSIIIPNGINDFWFKNKGYAKKISHKNTIKLLYVGVVNKRKNPVVTAKAAEILNSKGYDVQFTIVGKILDQSIYQQLSKYTHFKYIEPLEKVKLIDIYRENDIFVMPSITETFGLVYAEAMSQGLPVIYTKNQGFDNQFAEGEIGYHVNCFNPEDISERIIEITKNYEEMSKRCIINSQIFHWEDIAKTYKEDYYS